MTYKIGDKGILQPNGYTVNEGNGTLWKNKNKEEGDKKPDYRGNVNLDGETKDIALWIKSESMVTIKIQEPWDSGLVGGDDFNKRFDELKQKKEEKAEAYKNKEIPTGAMKKVEAEFDDDIPF
tara:strand:+ start:42 stop:410 length:369 start_codon:yes stop_codon:yes gene_type:complete